MQYLSSLLAASTLASFALAANTITLVNQDTVNKTVVFTPSAGSQAINTIALGGHANKTVAVPQGWSGNLYTHNGSRPAAEAGMLAEFSFNTWGGLNFYDVSAIVNPNDIDNVKIIMPASATHPIAGCQSFPCANAYNVWNDDLATKSTLETDFVVLVGNLAAQRQRRSLDGEIALHRKRMVSIFEEQQ